MNWYATEQEANEVLEYYENLILRSPYVKYVAVVESENKGYSLEIGITQPDKVFPINKPYKDTYLGWFEEYEIPRYLPIPSVYQKVLRIKSEVNFRKGKKKSFKYNRNTINTILSLTNDYSFLDEIKSSEYDFKTNDNESPKRKIKKWTDYRYGGQPIKVHQNKKKYTFKQPGSLGCVFELLEFPNELFGLSNWHIISGNKKKYGDKVFNHPDNNEIGELFWDNLNIHSEVGVFRLNKYCKKIFADLFPKGIPKWKIKSPEIGMEVFHFGYGTDDDSSGEIPTKKIRSINATIKINQDGFRNKKRIFKNQILIEDFTKDGDSGSCVLTKEEGSDITFIVGLNFSISQFSSTLSSHQNKDYSIANNISLILNQIFEKKQEVFNFKDDDTGTNNNLINRFTLKDF